VEPAFVEGADGVPIATWDLGGAVPGGATGSRPTLLLAHATGFHTRCYRALADGLADRFRVVGFDLRGHGHSGTPALVAGDDGRVPTMDWGCFADDALAVVDALGLVRPLAFGHSCGGAVLLMAEQRRPGTLASIYTYEPVVMPPAAWRRFATDGRDPAAAALRRRADFASRAAALEHYSTKPPLSWLRGDVLVDYVKGGFADRPDGTVVLRCAPEAEAATYAMAARTDAWDRLSDVACPVTVACGGGRADFGRDAATALAARVPRGRGEEHPDLGHLGPLEQPDEIAEAVGDTAPG